jgi:hypothetical protein
MAGSQSEAAIAGMGHSMMLNDWLERHNLANPEAADFALTSRSKRLCAEEAEGKSEKMFVTVMAVPTPPWPSLWKASEMELYSWLKDPARRCAPMADVSYLPGEPKAMHNGIIMSETNMRTGRSLRRYLCVERSGIIELGLGACVCKAHENEKGYLLTPIIAAVWHFLGFAGDFYAHIHQTKRFTLLVNMRETDNALLGGLANGWRHPWATSDWKPRCYEANVQIRHDELNPAIDADAARTIATEIAYEIESAWGAGGPGAFPRCFRRTPESKQGEFDLSAARP